MKLIENIYNIVNSLVESAYREALMGHELSKTTARISEQTRAAVDRLYKDDTCAANREADRILNEVRAKVRASTRRQSA